MNRRNFIKSMIATLVAPVAISQTPTVVPTEFTCKAAEGIEPYRTGYYGYLVLDKSGKL